MDAGLVAPFRLLPSIFSSPSTRCCSSSGRLCTHTQPGLESSRPDANEALTQLQTAEQGAKLSAALRAHSARSRSCAEPGAGQAPIVGSPQPTTPHRAPFLLPSSILPPLSHLLPLNPCTAGQSGAWLRMGFPPRALIAATSHPSGTNVVLGGPRGSFPLTHPPAFRLGEGSKRPAALHSQPPLPAPQSPAVSAPPPPMLCIRAPLQPAQHSTRGCSQGCHSPPGSGAARSRSLSFSGGRGRRGVTRGSPHPAAADPAHSKSALCEHHVLPHAGKQSTGEVTKDPTSPPHSTHLVALFVVCIFLLLGEQLPLLAAQHHPLRAGHVFHVGHQLCAVQGVAIPAGDAGRWREGSWHRRGARSPPWAV